MKTFKAILILMVFTVVSQANAQFNVNVNLGTPPTWAPNTKVATQYYYLPEINSYYDVPSERFLYVSNGKWVKSKKLPKKYSNYNLRHGKVIYLTDYRGNAPYTYNKKHKQKYVIVDSKSNRVILTKKKPKNRAIIGKKVHKNKKYKNRKYKGYDDDDDNGNGYGDDDD